MRSIAVALAITIATASACSGKLVQGAPPERTAAPAHTTATESVSQANRTPTTSPAPIITAPLPGNDNGNDNAVSQLADSIFSSRSWIGASHSLLAIDLGTGDTIVARNTNQLMIPASNQKLLTAVVAMETLGANFQWRTPVLLDGTVSGTTLNGDIILIGSGDPSWSDSLQRSVGNPNGNAFSAFSPIVAALRARGIVRVTGSIRALGDAFPGKTTGPGWEADDFDASYGAAVDELMFNNGSFTLHIVGAGNARAKATVRTHPVRGYPPTAVVDSAFDTRPNVFSARYDSTNTTVIVAGPPLSNEQARITMAFRHPNDAARAALIQYLRDNGISLGDSPVRTSSSLVAADTLVVLQSVRLQEVLSHMQKPSQNQIAESIFRTSGLHATTSGTWDSASANASRVLSEIGIDSSLFVIRDGSGMSRHNLLTTSAVIHLLRFADKSPYASIFRESLPVAGIDGTLRNRMRGSALQGNVAAKTGSQSRVRTLSGYVTTASGKEIAFSFMVNNFLITSSNVDSAFDMLLSSIVRDQ